MYHAGVKAILSISRDGGMLSICPAIPSSWPGYEVSIVLGDTGYRITVENAAGDATMKRLDRLDDRVVAGTVRVPLDGRSHELAIRIVAVPENGASAW